jgi:hypothetical protein
MDQLPLALVTEIASYVMYPIYSLSPDIPERKINKSSLVTHPLAVHYLLHHPDRFATKHHSHLRKWWIPWDQWNLNPNEEAVEHIIQHPVRIHFKNLCLNSHPRAVEIVLSLVNTYRDGWMYLAMNPHDSIVTEILRIFHTMKWESDTIEWWKTWFRVTYNENERIATYFLEHPEHVEIFRDQLWIHPSERLTSYLLDHYPINWVLFSQNKSNVAARYMIQHADHVIWGYVCKNPNEILVTYLLEHTEQINWYYLSENPNPRVLDFLLKHHRDKIQWDQVSKSNNPRLFVLDREHTNKRRDEFVQVLIG